MASVTVDSAVKKYGEFEALHSVSMQVEDGEFVVLVGPSGCGKTTLLRMIAGLETITGGQFLIGGEVVNDLAPRDRDIAMVFQNYALYPHMTVAQNMAFSMSVRGASKAEMAAKIRDAAAILGLEDYLDRKPKALSGGQRQRVAMGRALVRNPQVFLFDEPLSNLDAKLRGQMRSEIKSLMHKLKATTIYVTHDQIEAMTMADRIVVMRGGNIEQIGSPLEVYDRPATLFVAGFIGSPGMNFLRGTLERAGTGPALRLVDGSVIALGPRFDMLSDGPVFMGIRPEDTHLSDAGLEVEIDVVEPTGAEVLLLAKRGDLDLTIVSRSRQMAQLGDQVRLSFDLDRAHFFDPETERRIDWQAEPAVGTGRTGQVAQIAR